MLYDTHRQHRRDPPAQEHTSLPPPPDTKAYDAIEIMA